MSMLMEGPKQPGNDINLYLGLLTEELDTLWKTPANTWDAAEKEYFPMRAALLTTVHDSRLRISHGAGSPRILWMRKVHG